MTGAALPGLTGGAAFCLYRIKYCFPIFPKVRVGAPSAAAISLLGLRAKCPHFKWVSQLERLRRRGISL